jgi:hypothetical protein
MRHLVPANKRGAPPTAPGERTACLLLAGAARPCKTASCCWQCTPTHTKYAWATTPGASACIRPHTIKHGQTSTPHAPCLCSHAAHTTRPRAHRLQQPQLPVTLPAKTLSRPLVGGASTGQSSAPPTPYAARSCKTISTRARHQRLGMLCARPCALCIEPAAAGNECPHAPPTRTAVDRAAHHSRSQTPAAATPCTPNHRQDTTRHTPQHSQPVLTAPCLGGCMWHTDADTRDPLHRHMTTAAPRMPCTQPARDAMLATHPCRASATGSAARHDERQTSTLDERTPNTSLSASKQASKQQAANTLRQTDDVGGPLHSTMPATCVPCRGSNAHRGAACVWGQYH